jgi:hypothetical protein
MSANGLDQLFSERDRSTTTTAVAAAVKHVGVRANAQLAWWSKPDTGAARICL